VAEGLADVCIADPDGPEQNDGLAGVEPAQGREVADLGDGRLRGGVEVEAFQGGLLPELRFLQAPFEGFGRASGDLVPAEDLEEVEVSVFAFPAAWDEPATTGASVYVVPDDRRGVNE
jgi:hypothetical protein